MPTHRVLAAALVLFSVTTIATEAARGADFRVDNAVFAEGQSQPQSQGVTIFYQGLVYDFLNEPSEIIVFDKAHRRFTLLDISRHVQSQISIEDVQAVVNRVKQRLAGHPNPNSRWLVDPSFEESYDHENSELTLKSPTITYQAQVQATAPAVAAQYHEFSDWYTQFNLALNPSSRPPFPRMMLNEAIERHQGVAKEVHLSTTLSPKDVPNKITSRHQLAVQLDSADMNRVAEAREYLRSFQNVSLGEYRKGK
ncbi:MAG: hypothetical protein ACLP9L_07665 [Thermoguttaceae bacterium]